MYIEIDLTYLDITGKFPLWEVLNLAYNQHLTLYEINGTCRKVRKNYCATRSLVHVTSKNAQTRVPE